MLNSEYASLTGLGAANWVRPVCGEEAHAARKSVTNSAASSLVIYASGRGAGPTKSPPLIAVYADSSQAGSNDLHPRRGAPG